MLCEFRGGSSLNQAAAQPAGKPDSLTIHIGSGIFPECQRVRSFAKLNPYFFKHGISPVISHSWEREWVGQQIEEPVGERVESPPGVLLCLLKPRLISVVRFPIPVY